MSSFLDTLNDRLETLFIYAFSLVAGFAIADAVKSSINAKFPENSKDNIRAKWIYALITVFIFIIFVLILSIIKTVEPQIQSMVKGVKKKNLPKTESAASSEKKGLILH